VIGLDEIVENINVRKTTARCVSLSGECHFMTLETFCDFVN